MSIVVREARTDEYDEVGRLTVEAYQEYAEPLGGKQWANYRTDLVDIARRAERGTVLVAESEGRLVGAVTYYPPADPADHGEYWWPPGFAYLRALAVHPQARRRGVGRILTLTCVERAREQGALGIALNTTSLMGAAQSMYEGMGFRLEKQDDSSWLRGLCIFFYVLPLQSVEAAVSPEPV